jgi:predicted AlkP superfamily phosphohydrolase/phosphomutase
MRKRTAIAALLVAALVAVRAAPQPRTASSGRVILLSIDAGADWIFDELLARGAAPAFARLADEGAHADAMITVLPTLTAVSHASLWTGAWPRVHGITGNNVPRLPRSAHRVTETQSGFENDGLTAEPLWLATARQGRRAFVAQATGAAPFTTTMSNDRLLMFDTYSTSLLPIELVEGAVSPDRPYQARLGDQMLTVTAGPGAPLDVTLGDFKGTLTPGTGGRFSPPIRITVRGRVGYTRLRLIRHSPSTHAFLMLRGRVDELQSNQPARIPEFRAAAGGIVGENITRYYARGRFGPTRAEGGDGTAEELVAQIVEANHEYFAGIVEFAARERWDLMVLYVSTLDITGHTMVGMMDPANPAYRREVADAIWPVIDRVVSRTVDPLVAALRGRFADANLLVAADHGMEGVSRAFNINAVLRRAGLETLTADGKIDLAHSQAVHLPSTGGAVWLNTTDWKDGIVPPASRESLKRTVAAALLSARDPANGTAPVRAVFDADVDGEGLGIGGPAGPDLIVDTAAGYVASASLTADADVTSMEAAGSGEHGNAPWHRNLHAIFFAAGPQIDARTNPGIVRTIDIAPTVARLLGIQPPANSAGRVIPLGPTTR